jgi:ketosteroid isomerase-like protein
MDMVRKLSAFVLVVALGPFALAQAAGQTGGKAQQGSIDQTLRALSDELAKVPVTRDAAVLRRIWAADFVYVEPSGRVFNKDEGIADVAKITDKTTSAELSNVKVRVYGTGTVAVVIGDDREIGRDKDGKAFDRKSRFTNVWVLQNGSWQCVSGHSSDLPSK